MFETRGFLRGPLVLVLCLPLGCGGGCDRESAPRLEAPPAVTQRRNVEPTDKKQRRQIALDDAALEEIQKGRPE